MSYGRIGYGEGGGNLPKLGKILNEFAGKIGLLEASTDEFAGKIGLLEAAADEFAGKIGLLEAAADDDISFDVTPATVTADIADQNEEGYTREVVIKLVNTAGDTLAYNGEVAVVVTADTAGDGDASLVGDNPIMTNGVATATVALTGTYAAADTNTLTVSQKTILGVTVSAATSVETSEDASAE